MTEDDILVGEEDGEDIPEKKEQVYRPLGINLLIIMAVAGTFYSFAFFQYIQQKQEVFQEVGSFLQIPFYQLSLGIGIFSIIISFIIAYGLFTIKTWAWYLTVIFETSNVITSTINFDFVRLIISLIIVLYLLRPFIKRFYSIHPHHGLRVKATVALVFLLFFIPGGYIAAIDNPIVKNSLIEQRANQVNENDFVGTWKDSNRPVTLVFSEDHSCFCLCKNTNNTGTWSLNYTNHDITFTWKGNQTILIPYYYYPIQTAQFWNYHTIALYSTEGFSGFILNKITG